MAALSCGMVTFALIVSLSGAFKGEAGDGQGSLDLAAVSLENPADQAETFEEGLFYVSYRVAKGDTISELAQRFNVFPDSIISFNGIKQAKSLQIGHYLRIPSMNGILYTAKPGDTVEKVAETYKISPGRVRDANGLSSGILVSGSSVFLPDARFPNHVLNEINGDLFRWPVRANITSWYGWRNDPFSGSRIFHNGVDLAAPTGTPVFAAMDGVVSQIAYTTISGNFMMIRHASGYSSFYGHLSSTFVPVGTKVGVGAKIAAVGNSGYSTGSHLHFTVFKYGRTINPIPLLF
ncbi:MAG: M23 family metallopeptidase [Spirochaetes bacterium]|nr:M23 family metallopeptidase [Spirochaetota bacterium]